MRILTIFSIICCVFLAACSEYSTTSTLDVDKADSKQAAEFAGKIEIPVGMKDAQVLQLLGPADSSDTEESGHHIWRYSGKRAEYVYVSNKENGQTLIIGNYIAAPSYEPGKESGGLPLLMTIIFDPSKKVVNFTFAQMVF
jgi:hypothetical protein